MENTKPKLSKEMEKRFDEEFDICNNPDHDFIDAVGGETARLGCPVCGGDPDKKILIKLSKIKHFLATALEEQRLGYVELLKEHIVFYENDDDSKRLYVDGNLNGLKLALAILN